MTVSCKSESESRGVSRRSFLKLLLSHFAAVTALVVLVGVLFKRFLYPSVSYQKSRCLNAGFPIDYHPGKVDERHKAKYGIFIARTPSEEGDYLFALSASCTHLGCMVNFNRLGDEFVCPCHGSRYRRDGVNFSGPASRPLDLVWLSLREDGSIMVDADRLCKRKSALEKITEKEGFYLAL